MINTRLKSASPPSSRRPCWKPGVAFLLKGLLVAWLFASILFAHGCHGNEDQELFGTWMEWTAPE